jgi:transketolase
VIVDANGFQAMGRTDEVLSTEPLVAKFEAFGFATVECDGHDLPALTAALTPHDAPRHAPRAVIARTVKGHGLSFAANDNRWHYTRLDEATRAAALEELR